ncbi:putative SCAN domain-containing protein SCAND2P, partial [Triplophysa rosa]
QATSGTPFADIIASLAVLHREQHQALLDLRNDHELRFQSVFQAQREDRESFRSWMDQGVRAEAPATTAAFLPLSKMGPEDDPEAFLDLFEKTAETSGWPPEDWARRLLPLLSGEAQLAARPLPIQNLLVFDDLKRAILQRVGRSPEEHRQRFRSLGLGESGRPFVMAHQLRDSCRKWLLAGNGDVEDIIDRVVLEQFIARLPKKTAEWVQCHRPTSLGSAIQLAEDQMVVCPGVGEPLPAVSLSSPEAVSLSPSSLSLSPVPTPRSRPPGPPRVPPRRRFPPAVSYTSAYRAPPRGFPDGNGSNLSPRPSRAPLSATRMAETPGPVCWRCGDPDHWVDRCPVMEVGTMIRVPDTPQAAPGQNGGYQIPVSIGGVHTRLWWIPVVTKPPSIRAWFGPEHWIIAAWFGYGAYTGMW